jgi:uncharacterized protein (DUF305 family)
VATSKFTPRSWAGLAIILAIGLLLGYAAGFLTPRNSTPGDTSAEAGFARDMSLHHAQAVAMAMIAYQKGYDGEIRVMGGDIALTQQAQIGIMGQWLDDWKLNQNSTAAAMTWMPDGATSLKNGLMPGMATSAEMTALENARGTELDKMFLQMMINHHLGGIHMVEGVLKVSTDPEVVALANGMKANQQVEVAHMQKLLTELPRKTG